MPNFMTVQVKGIESDTKYRAFYYCPQSGNETEIGTVNPDADGNWQSPRPPIFQDWLLVLEKTG